jgi:hypothetical protein
VHWIDDLFNVTKPVRDINARFQALLRKAGERSITGLWGLIGKPVDIFKPYECANFLPIVRR